MNRRRIGKFKITNHEFKSLGWDSINKIFKDVFIIKAEYLYESQVFNYTAYSKHFDVVPEGSMAPYYDVGTFNNSEHIDGVIHKCNVTWSKIELR